LKPRAAGWFSRYEAKAKYNLAESYVEPMSLDELLELTGERKEALDLILHTPLDYRFTSGVPDFRSAVASLYKGKALENVLVTSGAINANYIAMFGLVRPKDRLICFRPNYQQLYAVPLSFGADVEFLHLRNTNGFLPDLDELELLVGNGCRMIVCSNPNNPTGAVMDRSALERLADIARGAGAYLLCDEIYKQYPRKGVDLPSVADIYEKGVSTNSLSKVYALSGLRIGWICAAQNIIEELDMYHNYTVICSGTLDNLIASIAFSHYDRLLARNAAIIDENLRHLNDWLALHPDMECGIPAAGTFTLLKYNRDIASEKLCEALFERTGVFMMPGSCFDIEGCVRLGFGVNSETFRKGLEVFSDYLQALDEKRP
jgi:aspartate/methionine/tyrosine aminotransferase